MNKLKKEFKKTGPPLKADLFAAVDAIFRIHFTYDLNATEVRASRKLFLQSGRQNAEL